jgi:hypothetical protein
LGGQVVDLVWLYLLENTDEIGGVGEIPIMKDHISVLLVRILIEVVDPIGIEKGRPALDAMDLVVFFQEQFSKVGPILSGDSRDECFFHKK